MGGGCFFKLCFGLGEGIWHLAEYLSEAPSKFFDPALKSVNPNNTATKIDTLRAGDFSLHIMARS